MQRPGYGGFGGGLGAAGAQDYTQPGGFDKALAIHSAGAKASATVAMAFPPWGLVAAAAGYATAFATDLIIKLRSRRRLALAGDAASVAPFVKKVAKWSSAKRKRMAEELLRRWQRHQGKQGRRGGFLGLGKRSKGETRAWQTEDAVLKLKLGALYAAEAASLQDPNAALIAGDPASVPNYANSSPSANMDLPGDLDDGPLGIPWLGWAAGAAALAGIAYMRKNHGA